MAPKIASRQLAYAPPPVPNFLQKLHSQVNQSRGNINDKRGRRGDDEGPTSEFDDLLGIGSSSKSASKVRDGKEEVQGGSDEEDEWDGAQIVVLKEGRHLSKEEAAGVNKDRKAEEETMPEVGLADGIVAVPQAAPASSSAAKRTKAAASDETESNGLDEVKNLIRSSKGGSENESEETIKKRKKEEKEKIKEEKNKRAKIEKSKRGKGLSFSMDD